jgi:putative colanic acid biosynthesis acetyltransferase WcaF
VSDADFQVHAASSRYATPWAFSDRLGLLLWSAVWPLFCRWTPKPLNAWRLVCLRVFGCKIDGKPFVHQRARIQVPWRVTLHDRSCVGDRANLYSLGEIELGCGCVIAQEAYLCTGTHDFSDAKLPLVTAKISVGRDAFVGARSFIMPGVSVGNGAVVGACSVVTKSVGAKCIVVGCPARFVRTREWSFENSV